MQQVLGTVKNTLTVWLGILMFGETVTLLQGVGYTISLIGFFRYNVVQMQLSQARAAVAADVGVVEKLGVPKVAEAKEV